MTWPFDPLRPLSHDLIVVDPPWPYQLYSPRGQEKSAQAHYASMPIEAIEALPLDALAAPDCLLMCWATQTMHDLWPQLPAALHVIDHWGFCYKSCISCIVWEKRMPSGAPSIGTGYRVRSMCEPVILASIGNPRHKPFPGLLRGARRQHSRKPDEFYTLGEAKAPLLFRRADVFARQSRPGWQSWGDESRKFDQVAA